MSNIIHETAIIGNNVNFGIGNTIGPFTIISGPCEIGDNNWIGPSVIIGTSGEYSDRFPLNSWGSGHNGRIVIGSNNVIREFTTIHVSENSQTTIEDNTYLMTRSYIPHDAYLEKFVKLATGVKLGGFAHIANNAYIGMGAIIHQKKYVGPGSMVGMGTVVTKNVPPLSKYYGNPGKIRGFNLKKANLFPFDENDLQIVSLAYEKSEFPQLENLSTNVQELFKVYLSKQYEG